MGFTLLPAVDVADGRAVRLVRGGVGSESEHGDPRDVALGLQAAGAAWIHLVDLDAAFGRGSNAVLLADLIGELDVPVQLSGGVRDDDSLERALATGCERVLIGTAGLADPVWCERALAEHAESVGVSLDVHIAAPDGEVTHSLAPRGGTAVAGGLWPTLKMLDRAGCARYVVTDVGRDGMLTGPNLDLCRAVAQATRVPVIASGGVSSVGDLVALAELEADGLGLEGAIVGGALYAGRFTLTEALDAMRRPDRTPHAIP